MISYEQLCQALDRFHGRASDNTTVGEAIPAPSAAEVMADGVAVAEVVTQPEFDPGQMPYPMPPSADVAAAATGAAQLDEDDDEAILDAESAGAFADSVDAGYPSELEQGYAIEEAESLGDEISAAGPGIDAADPERLAYSGHADAYGAEQATYAAQPGRSPQLDDPQAAGQLYDYPPDEPMIPQQTEIDGSTRPRSADDTEIS